MTRGECLEPGLGSPEMMADLEDQTADPTREELAEGPPPPPGWELGVAMGDIDPVPGVTMVKGEEALIRCSGVSSWMGTPAPEVPAPPGDEVLMRLPIRWAAGWVRDPAGLAVRRWGDLGCW